MSDEERVEAIFRDMRSGGLGWPERHRRNILAALSAARAEERVAVGNAAKSTIDTMFGIGGGGASAANVVRWAGEIAAAIRGRE